jgi:hypothetical protein
MPLMTCPECGRVFHLGVGNLRDWMEERYPDHKPDAPLYELYLDCWKKADIAGQIIQRPANN